MSGRSSERRVSYFEDDGFEARAILKRQRIYYILSLKAKFDELYLR